MLIGVAAVLSSLVWALYPITQPPKRVPFHCLVSDAGFKPKVLPEWMLCHNTESVSPK